MDAEREYWTNANKVAYEIAERIAKRRGFRNAALTQIIHELQNEGLKQLWKVRDQSPHADRTRQDAWNALVMQNAMKMYLRSWKSEEGHLVPIENARGDDPDNQQIDLAETLMDETLDGDPAELTFLRMNLHDLWNPFVRLLTPCEQRILALRYDYREASNEEIAELAGIQSGNSVRLHRLNIRKKAKCFIISHLNEMPWLQHYVPEGSTKTSN